MIFGHLPHISERLERDGHHTTAVDMTEGPIARLLIGFALPLILGNFFQVLYNTVDSIVVGRFVGTEALAAVTATSPLVNIAVFSFNGLSIGAGVVIGQFFGAHDEERLHRCIETTMALTLIMSTFFTVTGVALSPVMLSLISTPSDVMEPANTYLRIYFAGVTGLLIYNMASGILRAVGDSKRPLYFLIVTTLVNIVLDLLFVIVFGLGIAGVALATVVSELVSACMVLVLLLGTRDIYRLTLHDLKLDMPLLKRILDIGLPSAFQSMITSLSNSFVVAYINAFGSGVMAGWGVYNKLDQVLMLPIQSMGNTSATFVSQNIGAGKSDRADRGTKTAIMMITAFNFLAGICLLAAAPYAIQMFTSDRAVIESGTVFVRLNAMFFMANGVNHTLAGALRGRGDSKAPMIFMILSFVIIRQIYLFALTRFVSNYVLIGFSYPVGWLSCMALEVAYYRFRISKYIERDRSSR